MSVEVTYTTNVTVNETIDTNVPGVSSTKAVIVHDVFNTSESLTTGTTPPATKAVTFNQALTAGTATIDLTSLTGVNNLVTDGTGLKVQCFKLKNPAGNSSMNISVGATNGYDLAGAGFDVTLLAGQEVCLFLNDASPDVAVADAELDLTGTGTESFQVTIVLG